MSCYCDFDSLNKEETDYECIITRVGLMAMSEVKNVFLVFNVIFIKVYNKVSLCFNRKPFTTEENMMKDDLYIFLANFLFCEISMQMFVFQRLLRFVQFCF